MVHRSHGRGTLQIDRRFGKVLGAGARARIQVASGTNDLKLFRALNVMLDEFAERQPGLLEELRDHRLTPLQAYRLWISGKWLRYTAHERHAAALVKAVTTWAKKRRKLSDATLKARAAFAALVGAYAKAGTPIADLPSILSRYREDCEDEDTASSFNHARHHAFAFLRDTLKKSDPLYLEVRDLRPLKETPKIGRHAQTPEGARAIATKLGGEAGQIWLSLCYTGMNIKEFYRDGWATLFAVDAIHIAGKKADARERWVPLLMAPITPTLTADGFRSALRRKNVGVTPHDARRSYANWLVAAGIPANRRAYYRGHAPQTMGELYEQPDDSIRAYLVQDGRTLRAYLGLSKAGLSVESA